MKSIRARKDWLLVAAAMLTLASVIAIVIVMQRATRAPATSSEASELQLPDTSGLPLAFEPNAGQTDPAVRFLAHDQGGLLYFTPSEVVLSLASRSTAATKDNKASGRSVVRVQFVGANEGLRVEQGSLLPGKVNYFLGNDPAKWHPGLDTYSSITYKEIFPLVSLSYTGKRGHLEGTYTLAPGADPAQLRWRYSGVHDVRIDEHGDLQLVLDAESGATITERAPVAWQEVGGRKFSVSIAYQQEADGTVAFRLGSYNPAYPLVIDPTLIYSTYLGGTRQDEVHAVSQRGHWSYSHDTDVALVGRTASTDFPNWNALQPDNAGGQDAFVTVLSGNYNGVVFSTYLGGSSDDVANGVALDAGGLYNWILVTGVTTSTNFPTIDAYQPNNAGGQDAFMAILSSDGRALAYSTYFGGSGDDVSYAAGFRRDLGSCCVFETPYFVGGTDSTDFPVANAYQPNNAGGQDAFLVHFTYSYPIFALQYSTYLGGSGDDVANGISVSLNEEPYLTGSTNSTDFPMITPYQPSYGGGDSDAFVAKFDTGGYPGFSTYLGGSGTDRGYGIAVDSSGHANVAGATTSVNFPTHLSYQSDLAGAQDAFVTKLDTTGASLSYSTYLGGTADDEGRAIAVDAAGFSYTAGWTDSSDFPTVNPVQPNNAGGRDAFSTKFELNGSAPVYSTYLGGSAADEGLAVAVQTQEPGIAYVGGQTDSSNYPTVNPVQENNAGGRDGFLSTIYDRCGPYADYAITETTGIAIVPGTTDIGNHCDTCKTTIQLPFTFHLYDAGLTQINAGSDGYLEWGTDHTAYDNGDYCGPYSSWGLGYAIMPHFDNLLTDCAGCGIFTSISGTAPNRIFNIEWRANRNVGGSVNFEARLYEGAQSRFDFVYGSVAGNGDSATIGVQKKAGFLMTQYSCNTASLSSGLQLSFAEPPCESSQPTSTPTNTPTPTATQSNTPTLAPTFTPITPTSTPCTIIFTDVPSDNVFYPYIRCLACRGIISGYNDNTFRPNNNVTRGQAAKILANSAGYDEQIPADKQTFEDVEPGSTFWLFIERVALHGAISGYQCGQPPAGPCIPPLNKPYFLPANNLTRGQLAKIDASAKGYDDQIPSSQQTFEDVAPDNTFWLYIERVYLHGVINGYQCGQPPAGQCVPPLNKPYFLPFNNVTRGQTAKIVANTFYPNCQTPNKLNK